MHGNFSVWRAENAVFGVIEGSKEKHTAWEKALSNLKYKQKQHR